MHLKLTIEKIIRNSVYYTKKSQIGEDTYSKFIVAVVQRKLHQTQQQQQKKSLI